MKKMRERYQDNMAIVPMNNMYSLTSTFIQKQNDYKPEIKNVGMSPKKKGLPRVLDLSDLDIIDTPKRGAQSKEKKGSVRVNRKPSEQGGDDKLAEKDTGVLIVNKVYPDDEKEIDEEGVIVEIDEEDGYDETPLPEETIEELPEETIEELPEETIEELPEETIEELPEETIEELPEETIEELPEETIEETTEGPVVVKKKVGGSNNGDVKTIVVTSFF
jgi:hypothetical protein